MGFTHARSLEIPEAADEITSGPRTDDARTDLFTVLSGHNHRLVLLEVFSRPIFACPPNNVTQVKHVQHTVKEEGKKIKEKKDTRRDFPLITLIVCWNNTPISSRPVAIGINVGHLRFAHLHGPWFYTLMMEMKK